MEPTKSQLPEVPKWVQTRSWEVELLVTGGAIFSLLQLYDALTIEADRWDYIGAYSWIILLPAYAIRILMFYFAVHLITRSYWLSLISLQKLYPEGIDLDKLKYGEPFHSIAGRFNLGSHIANVDKFCSILFSLSFTISIMFIGFFACSMLCIIPFWIENPLLKSISIPLISLPLSVSLLLFMFDLFFHGPLRKPDGFFMIGKFNLYLPVYRFWNSVSLGFIWRSNLQIIASHMSNQIKLSAFMFASFLVGLFSFGNSSVYLFFLDSRRYELPMNLIKEDRISERRYMDKLNPEVWHGSAIQSEIITENYLKVFIPYHHDDDVLIDSVKGKHLADIIKIKVDDSLYSSLQWLSIMKINRQKGIVTVVDITGLEKKMHRLRIERAFDKYNNVVIPFWKQ